ncbi:hypothetical protein [Bradyrhizobium sp. LMG 9283]|uniref:hypothetical protein n=1 Tax=Bradyrhizobium sp. LMG 9283 TaxID=592064 RepID=UPI00388E29DD
MLLVVERDGPVMFARIGVMQALNRGGAALRPVAKADEGVQEREWIALHDID